MVNLVGAEGHFWGVVYENIEDIMKMDGVITSYLRKERDTSI